jgi:hypothetical protein
VILLVSGKPALFSQPVAEVVSPSVRVALAPFPASATAGSLGLAIVAISLEVFMKAVVQILKPGRGGQ